MITARSGAWFGGLTGARFSAVILVYFAGLCLLRLVLFPGASEDDAEQLFYAQSWALGYKGNQPPLYTWMVMAVTHVLGTGLAQVVAIKFVLLAVFYLFFHQAARLILEDDRLAALATLSLSACFFIGWDSVLNFTNTVLLAAAMAATVWALIRLEYKHGAPDYALLGFVVAVGLLAKYNYGLFLAALMVGALRHYRLKARLLNIRLAIPIVIAAVVAAPAYVWFLSAPAGLASLPEAKQLFPEGDAYLGAVSLGLWELLITALGFVSPFLPLAVLILFPAFRRLPPPDSLSIARGRFLEGYLLALGLALAGLILATGASDVRSNWMMVWFVLPLYVLLRVRTASDAGLLPGLNLRVFGGVLVLLVAAVPAALTVRAMTSPETCRKCHFVTPYEDLAVGLRDAGFSGGTVVAVDRPTQIAGNLRPFFPDARFFSTRWRDYAPPGRNGAESGKCLVIWNAERSREAAALAYASDRLGVSTRAEDRPGDVSVALSGNPERKVRLSYYLLPAQGSCR